jgi:hypothetical protein
MIAQHPQQRRRLIDVVQNLFFTIDVETHVELSRRGRGRRWLVDVLVAWRLFHGRAGAATRNRASEWALRQRNRDSGPGIFPYTQSRRNVMRLFFTLVGILAWIWALAVIWIFAASGGPLTVIAAGVFAIVAIVALGIERILKMLEDIRDRRITPGRMAVAAQPGSPSRDIEPREIDVSPPLGVPTV